MLFEMFDHLFFLPHPTFPRYPVRACCICTSVNGNDQQNRWLELLHNWLVVEPTHLKHMSQHGNLPQVGVKIKNI